MERPFRILVTDRNRHVRAFLRRELSQEGYDILEAGDCREVQNILLSPVAVDLLVLDPDIALQSQRHLLRTLKERYPLLRIVAHSLWDDAAVAGFVDATVHKSGSPKTLKAVVSRLLAEKRPSEDPNPRQCQDESWDPPAGKE